MDFFDRKGVLSDYLFGFRQGRSTEYLLAKATSDWSVARAKRLTSVIAFIDLSKAFDRVNHQALLLRLQQLGLGGQVLNWIANYLSNRNQRVCTRYSLRFSGS